MLSRLARSCVEASRIKRKPRREAGRELGTKPPAEYTSRPGGVYALRAALLFRPHSRQQAIQVPPHSFKYPRTVRSIPVAGQTLSDAIHRPRAVRAGAPVFRRLKRCFAATARPNRRRPIANHRQPVLVLSHATPGTHSPKTFLHEVVRRASRPTVGSVCIRRLSGSRSRVKSSHMPPLSVAASFQRLTASPSLWPRPVIISPQ
jgi:hypothetical protein